MDWLRENWFWIGVIILFIWFHMKMHGGHGSHGGGRGSQGGAAAGRRDPHAGHVTGRSEADAGRERKRNGGSHGGH